MEGIEQQLWDDSAEAWLRRVDQGDPSRVSLLDPVMLDRAGDVAGLRVLDVGCGEGRFCRMLAVSGACTVGVEPTQALLEAARQRHPEGAYLGGTGDDLPLADAEFDLVIAYLVLIDIPDFRKAIREMERVCKRGGRILVANLNSFATACPSGWAEDENGERLYVPVDNYLEERPERVAWCGIEVINYHRPLRAYMQAFLDSGLRLTYFEEPAPSPQMIAANPRMRDNLRVPYFNVMEWRKE